MVKSKIVILTHLPQEHCTHPHTHCLCTFRFSIFAYIWTSQKGYHNSQLTFLRNIALILTHVQVCQIPLTWPTNELPDCWPEAGVHQGMDAVVDWVDNEWNRCIATQQLRLLMSTIYNFKGMDAIVNWVNCRCRLGEQ